MISLVKRNRKLNISFRALMLDDLIDVSFLLMMCAQFCNHMANNYAYYVGFFLFLGLSLMKVLMRIRYDGIVNVPAAFLWYLSFTLFSLASMLWAEYPDSTVIMMTRMIQILVIMFCMSQNYATKDGFLRCSKLICWSGVICALYIFIRTPVEDWFDGKIGQSVTGANANTVGMIFTLCILLTFYYAYYEKKRLYYFPFFIEFMLVIMTSSRKSLLTVIAAVFLLIMIKDISLKIFVRVLVSVGLVVLVFYALMNVDELYEVAGNRFESMQEYLLTDDGDYSMYSRSVFIDYAKQFFLEKPLFGSGLASFSRKLGAVYGYYTYAHNNYYELLVGVGIAGFVLYYSFYAYLLLKLSKMSFLHGDLTAKLMFMIMVSIAVCEFGIVLYYSVYTMVFICLTFLYVCSYDYEHGIKRLFTTESSRKLLNAQNI